MSKPKNWLKGFKKAPKEQPPRTMEAIQAEYGQLSARAGQIQYQVFVLNKDLEQTNQALVAVNHEAAARQKLDAANAKQRPARLTEDDADTDLLEVGAQ